MREITSIVTTLALVILFAGMKIPGIIHLGWWFVFLPVYGPLLAGFIALLAIGVWNRIRKRI